MKRRQPFPFSLFSFSFVISFFFFLEIITTLLNDFLFLFFFNSQGLNGAGRDSLSLIILELRTYIDNDTLRSHTRFDLIQKDKGAHTRLIGNSPFDNTLLGKTCSLKKKKSGGKKSQQLFTSCSSVRPVWSTGSPCHLATHISPSSRVLFSLLFFPKQKQKQTPSKLFVTIVFWFSFSPTEIKKHPFLGIVS